MSKIKKRKRSIQLLIITTVLGFLFLHFYVPRIITEIKNPLVQFIKGEKQSEATQNFKEKLPNAKYITFKSFDGAALSGYLNYSSTDIPKGTLILLHGIRSNKDHFINLSQQLSKLGYNTVALDSRAHANSKGVHCTFGVKERKDISKLITFLEQEEAITDNIGVWGQSLGGAIALQAMGTDSRIQFGIIESTFSDFKTITNDYFQYHLGFNIKPLTNYLVYRAGKIANFNPEDAKPIKYCKTISQPILVVHGNNDQRINIKYAKANFAQIPSTAKEFIEIKTANHLNVWEIGGDDYFSSVLKFITKNTLKN